MSAVSFVLMTLDSGFVSTVSVTATVAGSRRSINKTRVSRMVVAKGVLFINITGLSRIQQGVPSFGRCIRRPLVQACLLFASSLILAAGDLLAARAYL